MIVTVVPISPSDFARSHDRILDDFNVPYDSVEWSTRPRVAQLCAEAVLAAETPVDVPSVSQQVLDQIPYDISHLGGARFVVRTVSHLAIVPLVHDEEPIDWSVCE
jgi:hypothetical protein